ncbi:MAG: hypothetical protein K2L10_03515 [Ruminococcus sp.]|nr:hypothetical protein [Ruminococcus sp.]
MEDEICIFATDRKSSFCTILVGEKCDGKNNRCSFRKTEEQFITERDRAISMNRERGNCLKCRYMGDYCRTSAEETVVDNFF